MTLISPVWETKVHRNKLNSSFLMPKIMWNLNGVAQMRVPNAGRCGTGHNFILIFLAAIPLDSTTPHTEKKFLNSTSTNCKPLKSAMLLHPFLSIHHHRNISCIYWYQKQIWNAAIKFATYKRHDKNSIYKLCLNHYPSELDFPLLLHKPHFHTKASLRQQCYHSLGTGLLHVPLWL